MLDESSAGPSGWTPSAKDLRRLRLALARDTGAEVTCSDEELHLMALTTLWAMNALLEIAAAQRARGILPPQEGN